MLTRTMTALLVAVSCFVTTANGSDSSTEKALSVVPDDSMLFVCAPDLKTLDNDVHQAIKTLGLEQYVQLPEGSLIALLRQELPFMKGLDENGSFIYVMMPAETLPELSLKGAMLIPTKDPKAMIEAMQGQANEDETWTATVLGQPAYLAIRNHHLVFGQFPDAVKEIKAAQKGIDTKLKAQELEMLDGLDLMVWIDGQRLFKLLKPLAGMFMPMMMAQGSGNAFEMKSMEMNKKNLDMMFDGVSTMSLGLGLDSSGLKMRGTMTVRPGSDLAKKAKVTATSKPLLAGIPACKYILAFGMTSDEEQMKASMEDLDGWLSLAEEAEGLDLDKVRQLKNQLQEWVMMIRWTRGTIECLKPSDKGLIGVSMIAETTDSARWLELAFKNFDLAKQIAVDSKGLIDDEEISNAIDAVSLKPAAEEIAGVKVSHLKFDLAKIDDLDEDEVEELTAVIGEEGLLLRMAAADAKNIVVTFGGSSEYMEQLLTQAGTDGAPLIRDTGIVNVSKHLPKERSTVYYLALDNGLALVQNILDAVDEEPLPIKLAPINAPLAVTGTGGDGWIRFDAFIPMEAISAGKNIGMTMMSGPASFGATAPAAAPVPDTQKPNETEGAKPPAPTANN